MIMSCDVVSEGERETQKKKNQNACLHKLGRLFIQEIIQQSHHMSIQTLVASSG